MPEYYLVARITIGGVSVDVFYDPTVSYTFWDELYISQGLQDLFGENPALGELFQAGLWLRVAGVDPLSDRRRDDPDSHW
jgi:hypothetical protein